MRTAARNPQSELLGSKRILESSLQHIHSHRCSLAVFSLLGVCKLQALEDALPRAE